MWILRIALCCVTLIVAESFQDHDYSTTWFHTCDFSTSDYVTTAPQCWWSQWGEWSTCNGTCSPHSWKERTRKCLPELCEDCGNGDSETSTEVVQCAHSTCCEGYPRLKKWSRWTRCSGIFCGEKGIRSRWRDCVSCIISTNANTGSTKTLYCGTHNKLRYRHDRKKCKMPCCVVYDSWSEWGKWSECSATCGTSVKTRTRKCNKDKGCPSKKPHQTTCHKPVDQMSKRCKVPCCPKPASWSDWGEWSECSVSCGQGHKTRRRTCKEAKCSNVTTCEGKRKEVEQCTTCKKCKEPKLGEWGQWSKCSVSCGKGEMQRTRDCNSKGKCQKQCEEKHKVDKKKCRNKCYSLNFNLTKANSNIT